MDGISPTFCFKPLIVFSMCAVLSDSSLLHPRGGVRVMKSKKEDKLKTNYNAYLHKKKYKRVLRYEKRMKKREGKV